MSNNKAERVERRLGTWENQSYLGLDPQSTLFLARGESGFNFRVKESEAMTATHPHGYMASHPATGECFASHSAHPLPEEIAEMMQVGALIQHKPLAEVKTAFCETHPSRRVVERGPSLGRYMDSEIPAWLLLGDETRYEYVATCGPVVDCATIKPDQVALAPGLVYQPIQMIWAAITADGKLRAMHSARPESADTLEAFKAEHAAFASIDLIPRTRASELPLVDAD
jgi:hypothetical protein